MSSLNWGPGEVFLAPHPRCPVHGQMHHDFTRCAWVCKGFDGEGCDRVVTDEQALAAMTPIGVTTETIRFSIREP